MGTAGQTESRALIPSPGIVASGRLTMCYTIRERGPKQASLGELDPAIAWIHFVRRQ